MYGIINALRDKGFSYRILADICDTTIMVTKASKKDSSVLSSEAQDKLDRLDRLTDFVLSGEYFIDPVAIFEEHILVKERHGEKEWVYLHELWDMGRMSDDELAVILATTNELYSYEELMSDYPMEYKVIDASDGYKSIVCELPIRKMTPSTLLFSS